MHKRGTSCTCACTCSHDDDDDDARSHPLSSIQRDRSPSNRNQFPSHKSRAVQTYPPPQVNHETDDHRPRDRLGIGRRPTPPAAGRTRGHPFEESYHVPPPTPPHEPSSSVPFRSRSAPEDVQPPSRGFNSRSNSIAGLPLTPPWNQAEKLRGLSVGSRENYMTHTQPLSTPSAMPGTMASREAPLRQSRSEMERRDHAAGKQTLHKSGSSGLATRFKTAFKDAFKREPIDESRFERIEDRHWTE